MNCWFFLRSNADGKMPAMNVRNMMLFLVSLLLLCEDNFSQEWMYVLSSLLAISISSFFNQFYKKELSSFLSKLYITKQTPFSRYELSSCFSCPIKSYLFYDAAIKNVYTQFFF